MKKIIYCLFCACFLTATISFAGCAKPVKGSPNSNPTSAEDGEWTNNY